MTLEEFLAALRRHFGLNESVNVSDSYEQLRRELEKALNLWPGRPAESLEVLFTFSDRLIAYSWRSESEQKAWEIPWQAGDNTFTLGDPVQVQRVVRYEPVGESLANGKGQRITESIEQRLTLLDEAQGGGRRVKAIGITADVVNGNGRRYPRAVLAAALTELNSHLHESAGQGRLILTGEAEHPSDKGGRPNILETVVKWETAYLQESGQVILEGVILPTAKGKDISVLVENGVPVGVSQRAYGLSKQVKEGGQVIEEVQKLRITGYDLVAEPSDPYARLTESQESVQDEAKHKQEQPTMNLEELLKLLNEKPELREALLNKLGLAEKAALAESLGVKPEKLEEALGQVAAAQKELADRKQREAIDAAIAEATKELKYGDDINKEFVEAVAAAKPETPEEVKALVETKRKEYDAIMSKAKLAGMGKRATSGGGSMNGVEVKGPVFERETGKPEFVRAAFELNESLIKAGEGHRRDLQKDESQAAIFAARALEAFDKKYQAQLVQESRAFEEAETTSDLNLPYSVARAIIEQAYPELVAANIYDFGMADNSPTRIYYETYAGENGAAPAVTDEDVTAALGAWVQMAHKRLRPGTVVVTNSAGSTTYVEGTDYVIDYEEGQIWCIAGTITNGQALKVDYVYDAFRKGEMQPIERAKNTLTSTLLEMEADRLAMQISKEAIVFSRSQMSYDAVTRTLGNLARLVRRKIDRDILYKGLAASLRQVNNSGGTWTSASDTVAKLVELIGFAKVKVYNRNYVPTGILMSQTNADRLSNWDGFKRDGFPNAILNAAGFAGSVKGLPIFGSTEYTDGYVQVVHRELVMHRVFQPLTFMGPFPSYDGGKLVGADQYYAEEFNGSLVPVAEKTAHVKIA